MMLRKSILAFSVSGLLLVTATGCTNHDDDDNPSPPALGSVQIDRMGRSAVNTALIAPFQDETSRAVAQDAYNAAADPSQWIATFQAEIASNLAIYDSLDTVCGNQLAAGAAAQPGRYDGLGGLLADDRLFVNTGSGTCETYLAVEAGVTNDCGGRTPLEHTINVTYSVLAVGMLSGVGDGLTQDTDGNASATTFPFYDSPL